jgi:acyl-CoA thioester hydrolase
MPDTGYAVEIPTRWLDTDAYGHVNNVQYYSYFDTAIALWLAQEAGFDATGAEAIGLCVESGCRYHAAIGFPETVTARVRVGRLGRSSVRYEIALHGERRGEEPVAEGHFVHVYVDRATRATVEIPPALRARMETLLDAAQPAETAR